MSLKRPNTAFSASIPQLDKGVLSCSCDDIIIGSVHSHAQNIRSVMFNLFSERNKIFFAGLSVPSYNRAVFTARKYAFCSCLYGSDSLQVAFVLDRLLNQQIIKLLA